VESTIYPPKEVSEAMPCNKNPGPCAVSEDWC